MKFKMGDRVTYKGDGMLGTVIEGTVPPTYYTIEWDNGPRSMEPTKNLALVEEPLSEGRVKALAREVVREELANRKDNEQEVVDEWVGLYGTLYRIVRDEEGYYQHEAMANDGTWWAIQGMGDVLCRRILQLKNAKEGE